MELNYTFFFKRK